MSKAISFIGHRMAQKSGEGRPKPKYPSEALKLELEWSFEQGAIQFIVGLARRPTHPARRSRASRVRTRICTSLAGRTTSELARKADEAFSNGTDLVEFRIDLLKPPSFEDIVADLSRFMGRSVVTVRPVTEGGGFDGDEAERLALLHKLTQLQPAYLDVELRTIESNKGIGLRNHPGRIIVSWHDTVGTVDRRRLRSVMKRAASYGGLVKIVTTAVDPTDNLAILSLYGGHGPVPIAFCMGPQGILSRVLAIERGSPIAYASLPDESTASGQLPLDIVLAARRRLEDV